MGVNAAILRLGMAIAALGAAAGARADNYQYTNITVPAAASFGAAALNDHGQVVGGAYLPDSSRIFQAFIWQDGAATLLPDSAYFVTINNKGIAAGVVRYPRDNTAPGEYVTYDSVAGTITVHDIKLNAPVDPLHLSEDGEIFGEELKFPTEHRGRITPFSYERRIRKYRIDGDKGSILRGANDAGDLLVQCRNPHICLYDLYSNGSFTPIDVPDSTNTVPSGIMESGQVVGAAVVDGGADEVAFVETDGSYVTYAGPVPGIAGAVAVLPSGEVFGVYVANKNGQSFALLNGTYYTLEVPGAVSTQLTAVNAKGDILGTWYDAEYNPHPFYAKCAEGKVCTSIKN